MGAGRPLGHSLRIAGPLDLRDLPRQMARLPASPDLAAKRIGDLDRDDPGKRAISAQITVCYSLLPSQLPHTWYHAGLSSPDGGEMPGYRADPPYDRAPGWRARTRRGRAPESTPPPWVLERQAPAPDSMPLSLPRVCCRPVSTQEWTVVPKPSVPHRRSPAPFRCETAPGNRAGPRDCSSIDRPTSPPTRWTGEAQYGWPVGPRRRRSVAPDPYPSSARTERACRTGTHRLLPHGDSRAPAVRSLGARLRDARSAGDRLPGDRAAGLASSRAPWLREA